MTETIYTPDSPAPKFTESSQELEIALKATNPYIWVQSSEEMRVVSAISDIASKMKSNVWAWSIYQGLVPVSAAFTGEVANGDYEKTMQPPVALNKISALRAGSNANETHRGNIVIMRDPHSILVEPILRTLRDLFYHFGEKKTKLVFLSPLLAHGPGGNNAGLPPTLEKQIYVMDFTLPDRPKILDAVKLTIKNVVEGHTEPAKKSPASKAARVLNNLKALTEDQLDRVSRSLQGLSLIEIKNAVSSSLAATETINISYLLESKKQILSKSDILEYFEPNRSMADIGGMDNLKAFFDDYKFSHSDEAKAFGLEPLRGVLKIGVPGCGKSQMVKGVASSWQLPLIRLDVGKVMTGLVGGSESKMRMAIKQVEAIAPCILWIDEIEKALSGTGSSNHSDGGTTARVFGTLLTAMEEGLKGVTILATANDIQKLPPELIRRFSEVFFVDLPGPDERAEIFRIHLGKKKLKIADFNMEALVKASNGFTGGEIEKSVSRSLAKAYKSTAKKVTSEMITESLAETKPISTIMATQIAAMRSEAKDKYRFASSWAEQQAGKARDKQKKMSMDNLDLPEVKKAKKATLGDTVTEDDASVDLSDDAE